MRDQEATPGPDTATDSPTAWFAVLERARLTDDYELAAKAQAELERLGVRVKFDRRSPKAVTT
jgi:hypothetical protein